MSRYLYATPLSGHCHRVCLLLNMLGLPYEVIPAPDAVRTRAEFKRLSPFGQIPVLVDGEVTLSDSAAIMVYLVKRYAPGSHWLPDDPQTAAQIAQWLGKAAGEIRYGVASARLIRLFGVDEDYDSAVRVAQRFLPQLDAHLQVRDWLVSEQPTIADLACYAYVAAAPQGGITLESWPSIRNWLARVAALPGFEPLPEPGA
ncbi:Glutathione S-transferase domain protein [Dickeya chrysanthemi Ech1591]|uniref:Glutathione S-transferase domain protein n=1 Tax=Dickeya chrysanthemi (strain Ech1591) TaxID=561229 RepID=C6CGF4_DICC1|nr:glutathione S-transferase [Dickeya chrysanthemi]ACT06723.1 Glutathione S-transferase domain protein [Dickeya chrysanthemi Ech1591]